LLNSTPQVAVSADRDSIDGEARRDLAPKGMVMSKASNYSSIELLRDGRQMEIRSVRPDDRTELLEAVARSSSETLYRRFFGVRRNFTDQEIDFFSNVDFVDHVALVVVVEEAGRLVVAAGARYVVFEPGKAEMAFAVVDQYQGKGIGTTLMRHLVTIARQAGLSTLTAEVLASNSQMLKVFKKSGLRLKTRRESEVVHVELELNLAERRLP
jgi:ribosomal protein S18 acetylase RimI-like enzyme